MFKGRACKVVRFGDPEGPGTSQSILGRVLVRRLETAARESASLPGTA
jgi:hypothetical protein